jgi:gamma-glutamyltranspeptidase/glutathione hydrolase
VLQNGGNAIDAAVAVSFALAVLQPEATGLGGGGFLTYFDADTAGVWVLDFRETSPAAAKAPAREGAIAAGVPGFVSGLAAMHERFGKTAWRELVAPAAAAAKDDLALTLAQLGERGAHDFYDGDLARRIVEGTRGAGGVISLRDLHNYKPVWRAAVRIAFRGCDIYTVPPPAAGGLMLGSILKIAGGLDLRTNRVHLLAEVERRAAMDRDRYLADPAGGAVPLRELLSDERAALWRASIDPKRVTPTVTLAEPSATAPPATGSHTTHVAIIDADGNVVSLTTSLGDDRGSGFVVPGTGVLLNDAMHDFATTGVNVVESGRRPASPLAPTIVMRAGKPLLAIGAAGGPAIVTTIAQILIDLLDSKQSLSDAIAAPRFSQQAVPEEVAYEEQRFPRAAIDALIALGHGVRARESIGDVEAVMIENGRIVAISDPRHGGAAGGY